VKNPNELVFCDETEWSCSSCTLRNTIEDTVCSVCETPRTSAPPQQQQGQGGVSGNAFGEFGGYQPPPAVGSGFGSFGQPANSNPAFGGSGGSSSFGGSALGTNLDPITGFPVPQTQSTTTTKEGGTLSKKEFDYYLCISSKPLIAIAFSSLPSSPSSSSSPSTVSSSHQSVYGGSGWGISPIPSTKSPSSPQKNKEEDQLVILRGDILQAQAIENKWLKITIIPHTVTSTGNTPIKPSRPYYIRMHGDDQKHESLFEKLDERTTPVVMGATVRIRSLSDNKLKLISDEYQSISATLLNQKKSFGRTGTIVGLYLNANADFEVRVLYHEASLHHSHGSRSILEEKWILPCINVIDYEEYKQYKLQTKLTNINCCLINDIKDDQDEEIDDEEIDVDFIKSVKDPDEIIRQESGCALLMDIHPCISQMIVKVLNHVANPQLRQQQHEDYNDGEEEENEDENERMSSPIPSLSKKKKNIKKKKMMMIKKGSHEYWAQLFKEAETEVYQQACPPPCIFTLVPLETPQQHKITQHPSSSSSSSLSSSSSSSFFLSSSSSSTSSSSSSSASSSSSSSSSSSRFDFDVEQLNTVGKLLIGKTCSKGCLPLFYARYHGHLEMSQWLLLNGGGCLIQVQTKDRCRSTESGTMSGIIKFNDELLWSCIFDAKEYGVPQPAIVCRKQLIRWAKDLIKQQLGFNIFLQGTLPPRSSPSSLSSSASAQGNRLINLHNDVLCVIASFLSIPKNGRYLNILIEFISSIYRYQKTKELLTFKLDDEKTTLEHFSNNPKTSQNELLFDLESLGCTVYTV